MKEAIRLEQVSLWRRTQEEFSYNLKKSVLTFFEGKYRQPAKKLVLDKIDLVLEQGEKVGIIGSNGAGKSTLLKVISGILQPTSGTLRVRGQIAPLMELGAGFDPEITVIDNILLYGTLIGFSIPEMRERAESILEFAEIEDYKHVPVKGLSSGMMARLAFAIATDINPDILILDEVLSVGDESFKNKSKKRMDQLWKDHVTILVVSHSMKFIQESCNKVIWMKKGRINLVGDSQYVIDSYIDSVSPTSDDLVLLDDKAIGNEPLPSSSISYSENDRIVGDEYVQMISGCIKNSVDEISSEILINETARVIMRYKILKESNHKFVPNFHIHSSHGFCVFVNSIKEASVLPVGEYEMECILPNFLNEGSYFVGMAISSFEPRLENHFFEQNILAFNIKDSLEVTIGRPHGFTGNIPGVIRTQLQWNLAKVS